MDRYWVPPSRLVGTDTVLVIVFEPGDELSAVGATREAIRAYTERRLGAEGAQLVWEQNQTADDPVLAVSFLVADLEEVDQAGYMISFTLEMRHALPVERHSDDYTTPILWMTYSLCYAPQGALANTFWPHFGGVLDEFTSAWRYARYGRRDASALPPVPARPEWLDDGDEAMLSARRQEFERLLDSADSAHADGPLADGRRESVLPAPEVASDAAASSPDPSVFYLPLHFAHPSPAVEPPRPAERVERPAPRVVQRKPPAEARRPRNRQRPR